MSAACENGHRHRLKAPGSAAARGTARPGGCSAAGFQGDAPTWLTPLPHPSSPHKERMEEEDFLS